MGLCNIVVRFMIVVPTVDVFAGVGDVGMVVDVGTVVVDVGTVVVYNGSVMVEVGTVKVIAGIPENVHRRVNSQRGTGTSFMDQYAFIHST